MVGGWGLGFGMAGGGLVSGGAEMGGRGLGDGDGRGDDDRVRRRLGEIVGGREWLLDGGCVLI